MAIKEDKVERSAHQRRVDEFMRRAEQEVPGSPCIPTENVRMLRAELILEEALETVVELGFIASVEIEMDPDQTADLVEIVDGCCDLSVVTTGTLSACGVSDIELQRLVDESNLAKFEHPVCKECGLPLLRNAEKSQWVHPSQSIAAMACCAEDVVFPLADLGCYKRFDGKWVKPKTWAAPVLAAEIERQRNVIARWRNLE